MSTQSSVPTSNQVLATTTTGGMQKSSDHLLYMYGAVTQSELRNFLEGNVLGSDSEIALIKANWRDAADEFAVLVVQMAGEAETIHIEPLSVEHRAAAEQLTTKAAFQETFSMHEFEFAMVEIDKLVASQRTVHVEYVNKLVERFKKSNGDLFSFVLDPPTDTTETKVIRGQNGFSMTSANPGLRYLGVCEQPFKEGLIQRSVGGQPTFAITLVFGYGAGTANAIRVGNRLILNNGFHRLYALRAMGYSMVPLVIQNVRHPQLELPQAISDLPTEYLIQNPRPALMADFFNSKLVCEVPRKSFIRNLNVQFGIQNGFVPA